jgi:hypothetical protein
MEERLKESKVIFKAKIHFELDLLPSTFMPQLPWITLAL